MPNTPNNTSKRLRTPLASIKFLKYLGVVSIVVIIYVLVLFYNHFGGDIFPVSLTIGQYIRISFYCIVSEIDYLIPLLFFAGALLYRSVRLKGKNPITAIKRDLLIIIPFGVLLWTYSAYFEQSLKSKLYAMIWDIEELEPGEKFVEDPNLSQLMKLPSLNGLHDNIDSLNLQINDLKEKMTEKSTTNTDYSPYIENRQNEHLKIQNKINSIHFTPLYILLFFIFGMLLGYLIPLNIAASTAIFIAISSVWFYGWSIFEALFSTDNLNSSWFLLSKVGVLLLMNTFLLILASKVYKQTQKGITITE